MFCLLPFLFIAVSVTEIGVFLMLGERLGIVNTLIAIVLTAFIGTGLMRQQGLMTLQRAQQNLQRGVPPTRELVDGLLILAAGLLLITPGFITDSVGFLMLFPLTRTLFRERLLGYMTDHVPTQWGGTPPRASQMEIIDDDTSEDNE